MGERNGNAELKQGEKAIQLDERGKPCPIPLVETKKVLEQAAFGTWVEVTVDNEIALQNLQKLAAHKGLEAEEEKRGEREFLMRIKAGAGNPEQEKLPEALESCEILAGQDESPEEYSSLLDKGTVLVISSDTMGRGDDELGRILMKSFLYGAARQERLPEAVLLYNGGAKLSCEGSASLEDLRSMEEEGCQVMTCGTCLDFYGLKSSLSVGQITNMYEIVEKMSAAKKVIRP